MEIGRAKIMVGKGWIEIPTSWKYHITSIDTIAPKDMNSPCAKLENLKTVRSKQPEKILYNAVKGMLPHNRLGRKLINHLKIYNSSEHPHGAQMPKEINF